MKRGYISTTEGNRKGGYTLVEMIVSLTLFITVLAIAMGALLQVVDANRKSRSMSAAMDNLSLAMEEMSRSLRQGQTYHCDISVTTPGLDANNECIAGASSIAFEAYYGSTSIATDQVHYRLATTTTTGVIEKSTNNGSTYFAVTPPSIIIEDLVFYVKGPVSPSGPYTLLEQHPRITLIIEGRTDFGSSRYDSGFSFQTTISQRAPEVD